ncbi:MAG: hypothetical protein JNN20_07660 [Betaproteobacteria bacterium]|nr:hypothetical protein [Betaproteobacteria bacterium]
MTFSPKALLSKLGSFPDRKFVWINLVVSGLITLAHGGALIAFRAANDNGADMGLLSMVYISIPLSCLVFCAACIALIRSNLTAAVLALHGVVFFVAAIALLVWATQILIVGMPAGNFSWSVGLLTASVFYSVFLFVRYSLPVKVRERPVVALAPLLFLFVSIPVDIGVLLAMFRDDVSVPVESAVNPPDPTLLVPKLQGSATLAERDGQTSGADDSVLLSTSFEAGPTSLSTGTSPFHQAAKIPWGRDKRARTGDYAINVIPQGNPGKLAYFNKPINAATLSSRLDGQYMPFSIAQFRQVELEFWRLSTSNPSESHNCLGSLSIDFKLDDGPWQSKMVFCGKFRSNNPEWREAKLVFDTASHKTLEIKFGYEYPPSSKIDKTAVYLIDDLVVRGLK